MSTLLRLYPGDGWALLIGNVLAQVTAVTLAAWLLARFGRRWGAALRYRICLVAMICVLASPALAWMMEASGVALVAIRAPEPGAPSVETPPAEPLALLPEPSQAASAIPLASLQAQQPETDHPGQSPNSGAPLETSFPDVLQAIGGGALAIWLLGIALLLARWCNGLRLVAALRREVQPLDGEAIQDVLGEVRRTLGVDRLPPIAVSANLDRPVMIGLLRPLVILPESLLRTLHGPKLADILVHECAHAVCRHQAVGLLQRVAGAVFWPHPLVHLLNRELAQAREEICDNYVLRRGNAPGYARTLLELSQRLVGAFPKPAALGLFPCRWRLEDRIAGILEKRRNTMTRVNRWTTAAFVAMFLLLAVLIAGMRVLQAEDAAPAPPASNAPSGQKVSAAALMKTAYGGQAWIDSARTFRIRTTYKITHTDEGRRAYEASPPLGAPSGAGLKLDPRPFCMRTEWAWDPKRIRYHSESYYEGETAFGQGTRIWDGSLAAEIGESADHQQKTYVLDNKFSMMFGDRSVGPLEIPWWPAGDRRPWWRAIDAANRRAREYIAPEDFELTGEEEVIGRRCHVLVSRVGHTRMYVGKADGRLYRRTVLVAQEGKAGFNYLALCQKIGGPSIKFIDDWRRWLEKLKAAERARAERELRVAMYEFARPYLHQTWDNYREAAPGCWLPYRQTIDTYDLQASEPFLASHSEQTVIEVTFNQPLADDLFRIKLTDGVPVATDWRYDPPIRYVYRKDQTEAERAALCEAERFERARQEFERARREMERKR